LTTGVVKCYTGREKEGDVMVRIRIVQVSCDYRTKLAHIAIKRKDANGLLVKRDYTIQDGASADRLQGILRERKGQYHGVNGNMGISESYVEYYIESVGKGR